MMEKHAISIWFVIGSLLVVYGVLILGAGVYGVLVPASDRVVMAQLHIGLWWGAGMLLLGLVYVVRFRPKPGTTR
jgi:hypothetical protein